MASPTEVAQGLPDTLPADFSEWDSGSSPAPTPDKAPELPAAPPLSAAPKPRAQFVQREAIEASFREAVSAPRREPMTAPLREAITVPERPRPARSHQGPASGEEVLLQKEKRIGALVDRENDSVLQKQRLFHELVDKMPASASFRVADAATMAAPLPQPGSAAGMRNAPESAGAFKPQAGLPPFRAFPEVEVEEEPERASKKWMIIPAVCAVPILGLGVFMFSSYRSGKIQLPKPAAQTQQATSDAVPQSSEPQAPQTAQAEHAKPSAAAKTAPATNDAPAGQSAAPSPTQAQADMMHDQLTAPTRIPQGVNQAQETAPPEGMNPAGAEGLGGSSAAGIPFSAQAKPDLKQVKPLPVSAGVAAGMLIRQTAPVYPPIARTARVSGVVELQATISKSGIIKDLHVVSGPAMLRQAAQDAVRTWRYKPFMLDNQPIEIQTTVMVNFSLEQ